MIDPLTEELVSPREAAKLYPRGRGGKVVHVSRVYRDILHGHDGIRLESISTPRLATSRQAVARFSPDSRSHGDLHRRMTLGRTPTPPIVRTALSNWSWTALASDAGPGDLWRASR